MAELETLESIIKGLQQQLEASQQACETERMRLAACGVIALSNTRESAKEQRKMHPDYHSASLDDVICAVDAEMDLREQLASANNELTELSIAVLNAVQSMSGGKAKAELRDAYDKASDFIEQLEGKG